MPVNRWMNKETVVYLYNGILGIKKWNYAICNIRDGPRDYAKWSKSEKNKYHILMCICEI